MSKKLKILYIEDDVYVAESILDIFKIDESLEVDYAKDGHEASNLFYDCNNDYDIVISDIMLPYEDGLSLIKKFKSVKQNLFTIIISAYNENDYLQKSINIHVDHFLTKPIDLREVYDIISNYKSTHIALEESELEKNRASTLHILESDLSAEDKLKNLDLEKFINDSFTLNKDLKNYSDVMAVKSEYLSNEKERFYFLFNDSPIIYLEVDNTSNIVISNKEANKFFNIDHNLKKKNFLLTVSKKNRVRYLQILNKCNDGESVREVIEYKVDGNHFLGDTQIKKNLVDNYYLISIIDITQQRIQEKLIKDYIKLIDENIITSSTDLFGIITEVSDAFCKISGYSREELIGKNHNIVRHPNNPKSLYKNLWQTIKDGKSWSGELENINKNGNSYWVDTSIHLKYDFYGNHIGYTSIRHNISDKKIIERISITDGLTELFNRRYFDEKFPKIINKSKRNSEIISFILLDIDNFKKYNDTYGHQMGDSALKKVAKCIKNTLKRADDYAFRLGGEEFGIVFNSKSKENAFYFSNKIKNNIQNLNIEHKKNDTYKVVTVSMGLYTINAKEIEILDIDELYKLADELLYKAKDSGRNLVLQN